MLECFIEASKKAGAASNLYYERYPERRQPFRDMFLRLKNYLINGVSSQKLRTSSRVAYGSESNNFSNLKK